MNSINDYFDKVMLINMERRTDRMEQAQAQADRFGFRFQRFEGHDMPGWGNNGCTASHRGVLELIAHHRWQRTLILEDDFLIIYENFNERFFQMLPEVPEDWDMLYLGAGYAEVPQARVSKHVIRAGHLKTTSSYAVTYKQARKMAPHIAGIGPIDELYAQFNRNDNTYIFDPRLIVQREGYSDIECLTNNHGMSMLDPGHVMLLDQKSAGS